MTQVTLHLLYCHSCSSWRLHGDCFTEVADEEFVELPGHMYQELGPFDGAMEALGLARAWLTSVLAASGRPWDAVPTFAAVLVTDLASLVNELEEHADSEEERGGEPEDVDR